MHIPPNPPHRKTDTLLPMINVVFLLLIFFLISAKITTPEPFVVTPPVAQDAQEAQGIFTIFVDAKADVAFRDARNTAAIAALSAARDGYCDQNKCETQPATVFLRADAELPAPALAALVKTLTRAGFDDLMLITAQIGAAQ